VYVNFIVYTLGAQMAGVVPFAWHLSLITPFSQILNNAMWFADGDVKMLLPRFEIFYPLICLGLIVPVIAVSVKKHRKKEIV
jgi:hypothetical protein